MGASRPPFSSSTRGATATSSRLRTQELAIGEGRHGLAVRRPAPGLYAGGGQRVVEGAVLAQRAHELDQLGRPQEREAPFAVVVRQRTARLGPERDPRVAHPGTVHEGQYTPPMPSNDISPTRPHGRARGRERG